MALPTALPLTAPALETVAIPPDEVLHTPPLNVSLKVVVAAKQTFDKPVIVDGVG